MPHYTTCEYDVLYKNEIPTKNFDELADFAKSINGSKVLTHKIIGRNNFLAANNFVGIIQTKSGSTLEILPKIYRNIEDSKRREILINMLMKINYIPENKIIKLNYASLKIAKIPLNEIFISMFLNEVLKIIKKGICQNYILLLRIQSF